MCDMGSVAFPVCAPTNPRPDKAVTHAQVMFGARVISDIAGRITPKTAWIQTEKGTPSCLFHPSRYGGNAASRLHGSTDSNVRPSHCCPRR